MNTDGPLIAPKHTHALPFWLVAEIIRLLPLLMAGAVAIFGHSSHSKRLVALEYRTDHCQLCDKQMDAE